MATSILTETQKKLLTTLGASDFISKNFYLSGGTALAGFYIPYRYSEDLDFFSLEEVDTLSLQSFWKGASKKLGITKIDFQQSFNRNLFFLNIGKDVVKTEFTYYPFPRIEKSKKEFGLEIDSVLDIATNKLFTIYQQPRTRDYVDLYMICEKYGYSIPDLILKAKVKFDWHVDPIQLGAQFLKVTEVKDYPRLIDKINDNEWQNFFIEEAKKLKSEILE